MAIKSVSKPRRGSDKIEHGRSGGTKFTKSTRTAKGIRQTTYNYPGPKNK